MLRDPDFFRFVIVATIAVLVILTWRPRNG